MVTLQYENRNSATTSNENSSKITSDVRSFESGRVSDGIINVSNGGATEPNKISVSCLQLKLPKLTLPKFKSSQGQVTK